MTGKENESIAEGLNERQKKFCEGYIFDWNGTRAYMAAYPDADYDSARTNASRLLANVNIKAYIEELKTKTAELAGVSALRVAKEFARLAFTDVSRLRKDWHKEQDWDKLTDDEKAIISGITTIKRTIGGGEDAPEIEETKLQFTTHDKQKALIELKKMFGYDAAEKIEVTNINPLKVSDDLE